MIRRNTNQRQIVYDAISFLGHTTTDELINYINEKDLNVSLATIYRNLTILLDETHIKKVKIGDLEVYESVKDKHYHFECKKCKKIIDVLPKDVKLDSSHINKIYNMDVLDFDMVFYGLCPECANKN